MARGWLTAVMVSLAALGCGSSSEQSELFGSGGKGTGGASTGGAASGGSGAQSTGGASGAGSGGTSAGGGAAGAGGTGSGGSGAGGTPAGGTGSGGASTGGGGAGGCASKTWCFDTDGDGFGAGAPKNACTTPGAGWIEAGSKPGACDDCLDQNQAVKPGSSVCSDTAYATSGGLSYDYDCDASEVACASFQKAETCKLGIGSCTGSGYLPVNGKHCGSMQFQKCELGLPPTSCKTSVVTAAPIKCK